MRKTLVFLPASEAEQSVAKVLGRLSRALLVDPETELLVIDDASQDGTARVASEWIEANGVPNATVLRNPEPQGFGGNQKLGYRYAVTMGFERVALLHADGRDAPEELPKLLTAMETGRAEVALGVTASAACVTGRLLAVLQRLATGKRLADHRASLRVYSTKFLRDVPFELISNDARFDTEILLQAVHAEVETIEVPIPSRGKLAIAEGDVSSIPDVLRSIALFAAHRHGFFCTLRYRRRSHDRYGNKTLMPGSTHAEALTLVREGNPKSVLDVGAGQGFMSDACARLGADVTMLDVEERKASEGGEQASCRFVHCDLEAAAFPVNLFDYDVVMMLDVIEHLANPEDVLLQMRNGGTPRPGAALPKVLISTPNVAFLPLRLSHLAGRFNYAERGILDVSHKRLFTLSSLKACLEDSGFRIEKVIPIGAPFGLVLPGRFGLWAARAASALARLWPRGLAFQFLIQAKPRPGVGFLLDSSARVMTPAQ